MPQYYECKNYSFFHTVSDLSILLPTSKCQRLPWNKIPGKNAIFKVGYTKLKIKFNKTSSGLFQVLP